MQVIENTNTKIETFVFEKYLCLFSSLLFIKIDFCRMTLHFYAMAANACNKKFLGGKFCSYLFSQKNSFFIFKFFFWGFSYLIEGTFYKTLFQLLKRMGGKVRFKLIYIFLL
jgi:hypothetical protein